MDHVDEDMELSLPPDSFANTSGDESSLCLGELPCADAGPSRPGPVMEWLGRHLLLALAPRLDVQPATPPPSAWGPFTRVAIPRATDRGKLDGWYFPARPRAGKGARGAVLMCHPWLPYGQSYFFRRRRVTALRAAGYHVLTFDFGGFGGSGPKASGFLDCDVEDALAELARRAAGLPLHLWGISAGGYWAHLALSRRDEPIGGAIFEHVTDHLIEWSKRTAPVGMPCYLFYQHVLAPAYRYLDLDRHAAHLRARAVAYVGGDRDLGIPVERLHRMAQRAGAARHVVPEAGHLEAFRRDGRRILELALETFRRAEED